MAAAAVATSASASLPMRALGRTWETTEVADGVQSVKKRIALMPSGSGRMVKPEADPFLLLSEDWIEKPLGFEAHPHRGFETVSIVFNGALEHKDYSRRTKGTSAVVRGLDVQWMRCGRGIVHSEMPADDSTTHMLQLWVNLPSRLKMSKPGHAEHGRSDIPVLDLGAGYAARVIAGPASGATGAARTIHPVTILDVTRGGLDGGIPGADGAGEGPGAGWRKGDKSTADAEAEIVLPASFNGFLYAVTGDWSVGGKALPRGFAGMLPPAKPAAGAGAGASGAAADVDAAGEAETTGAPGPQSRLVLRLTSRAKGRALVFLGEPIAEPVAMAGPFVMNTEAQLHQAFADYRAGKF